MLRSRSSTRFVVLLLAFLVVGCGGSDPPPAFHASFPPSSNGPVPAMAVSLIDQTGLVEGMAVGAPGGVVARAVGQAGDPNAVRIEWLGTDCDGRTTLVFAGAGATPAEATYLITVHTDPNLAGGFGCRAIDLPRAVTLQLEQPVTPERITIDQVYP